MATATSDSEVTLKLYRVICPSIHRSLIHADEPLALELQFRDDGYNVFIPISREECPACNGDFSSTLPG